MRNHSIALAALLTLGGLQPLAAQDDACRRKAEQALRVEEYDAALAAVRACPRSPANDRLRGICFHRLYNADSAIAYLAAAAQQSPADDAVLINGAEALLWKKEFRRAGEWLDKVADKGALAYRKVYALRLEMLGKFEQAVAFYDSMIASEKQPWTSLVRKGEVLSWMKRFDDAIALFTTVAGEPAAPKNLRMYAMIRKAEVTAWKRQSSLALNQLDSIIAMEAKPAQSGRAVRDRVLEALRIKGQVLEWDGRYTEARDAYKNMLLIDPDNKQAKLLLEKLLWVK